jgi:hypothetical protein
MGSREVFLSAAEKVAACSDVYPWEAGPWPAWFLNVALRLARVAMPSLKKSDLKERPALFHGYFAALLAPLIKAAKELDLAQVPDVPVFAAVKEQIERIRTVEDVFLSENDFSGSKSAR